MILDVPIKITYQFYPDQRGVFTPLPFEEFKAVQLNIVQSKEGVVRGLHGQRHPYQQAKQVYCTRGRIRDVVVDPSNWTVWTFDLCPSEGVYVPANMLHGYSSLEQSEVIYLVDKEYCPEEEWGINPLDSSLQIDWGYKKPEMSEKDRKLPDLCDWMTAEGHLS